MNHIVTTTSPLASLIPALSVIVATRNGPAECERYELEDTVLRAGGFAWDIGAEAAPLHAQIEALLAAKAQADAEARAAEELAIANYVPESVTPWQMLCALNQIGLRASVEAAVAAADQNTKDAWSRATRFPRNSPLLAGVATSTGMNDAQLDDLFRLAATFQ